MPSPSHRRFLLALAAVLAATGCGKGGGTYPIEEVRTLAEPRPDQKFPADTAQRLSPGEPPSDAMHSHGAAAASAAPGTLAWDLPAGWKELPPEPLRSPNFGIPGREKLACYVTVLPGGGGGVAANINRWRKQMGLAPASDADIAALPRVKCLGRDAPLVRIDGTFKGPGAETGLEGYTMAAVAAEEADAVVTVKLVGPAADVAAEADRFIAMCASLREAPGSPPDAAAGGSEGGASSLTWKAPAGWVEGPAKQMRLVTFLPKDAAGVECSVTILGGTAGGLEANVNRWRQQLHLAPLSAQAVAALPSMQVLGRTAHWVEIDGGTGGAMIALDCELGARTVFVKMTGPMAALRLERENFIAFCKSLGQP